MTRLLTQKQENFTLNLLKGKTQRESWIQAGYSSKYPLVYIDSHACSLANSGKIEARLAELRAEVAATVKSSLIADIKERQERLTQFVREDIVKEGTPIRTSNISSIAELNKMDHIYELGGNLRDVNVVFVIGKGYKNVIEGKVVNET